MSSRLSLLRRLPPLKPYRPLLSPTTTFPKYPSLSPPPLFAAVSVAGTALPSTSRPLRFSSFSPAMVSDDASLCLSVRIICNNSDAVTLSEALMCFGATSASMDGTEDLGDHDKICITSIFADNQDVRTCMSHAIDSIGLNYVPTYEVSAVEQSDWIRNVQETFHPVEVTKGLWIVPEWRSPVDLQATNIILNPGMAFGTGDHPTTMLCLLLLHGLIKGGEFIMDYGTGSGVLGIASVKMGAALSVGIDIDPEAVKSSRQNMILNGIDNDRMQVYLVPVDLNAEKEKFDLVVANILLNPLLELVEDIVSYGKPGAVIAISGILSEQVLQVEELYSQYLDDISVSEMDGWACLSGKRKHMLSESCRK